MCKIIKETVVFFPGQVAELLQVWGDLCGNNRLSDPPKFQIVPMGSVQNVDELVFDLFSLYVVCSFLYLFRPEFEIYRDACVNPVVSLYSVREAYSSV